MSWDMLVDWADAVLDEESLMQEHLSSDALEERYVIGEALFFVLGEGGWLLYHPDDPEMRDFVAENLCLFDQPDVVEAVLRQLREFIAKDGVSSDPLKIDAAYARLRELERSARVRSWKGAK